MNGKSDRFAVCKLDNLLLIYRIDANRPNSYHSFGTIQNFWASMLAAAARKIRDIVLFKSSYIYRVYTTVVGHSYPKIAIDFKSFYHTILM